MPLAVTRFKPRQVCCRAQSCLLKSVTYVTLPKVLADFPTFPAFSWSGLYAEGTCLNWSLKEVRRQERS
jgi:hypothetical protein